MSSPARVYTPEELEKWWTLRTGNPPVMAPQIAKRFGVPRPKVQRYLRERAEREGVTLPVRTEGLTLTKVLRGKFNASPIHKKVLQGRKRQ